MNRRVVDASTVLALLFGEEGGEIVADVIRDGTAISAVNLAEVLAKMVDEGFSMERAHLRVANLNLAVHQFTTEQAYRAAGLRPATRSAGLSLGDRACVALAQELRLPVLTAERSWPGLDLGVLVETIR